jgi:hypothetical protein
LIQAVEIHSPPHQPETVDIGMNTGMSGADICEGAFPFNQTIGIVPFDLK